VITWGDWWTAIELEMKNLVRRELSSWTGPQLCALDHGVQTAAEVLPHASQQVQPPHLVQQQPVQQTKEMYGVIPDASHPTFNEDVQLDATASKAFDAQAQRPQVGASPQFVWNSRFSSGSAYDSMGQSANIDTQKMAIIGGRHATDSDSQHAGRVLLQGQSSDAAGNGLNEAQGNARAVMPAYGAHTGVFQGPYPVKQEVMNASNSLLNFPMQYKVVDNSQFQLVTGNPSNIQIIHPATNQSLALDPGIRNERYLVRTGTMLPQMGAVPQASLLAGYEAYQPVHPSQLTLQAMFEAAKDPMKEGLLGTSPIAQGRHRARKWTEEEDHKVMELLEVFGPGSWVKIAERLKTKTPKQIHARWRDYLRKDISGKPWSFQELSRLAELHQKFGNQWSYLSYLMPGRSPNSIKNQVNAARRKRRVSPEHQMLWGYLKQEKPEQEKEKGAEDVMKGSSESGSAPQETGALDVPVEVPLLE